MLGIQFDIKVNFGTHISTICRKAIEKLYALSRMIHFMSTNKAEGLMKALFFSQFNYCLLVLMCHNQSFNSRLNHLQERGHRMIY